MKQVVLIGDSIRMGYQEIVRRELAGMAEIWSPQENGGDSRNVLALWDGWFAGRPVDLLHINCGLHDLKKPFDTGAAQVPLEEYGRNVAEILSRAGGLAGCTTVWAATTPVNEAWHHENKGFDRFEADVDDYNAAALAAAAAAGVGVDDLFGVVKGAGRDSVLRADGVHFEPEGCELLGKAVAACLKGLLTA